MVARLTRRLRSVLSPAVRRMIVLGCAAARRTGLGGVRASALLGYAQRRAGRPVDAVADYLAAVAGRHSRVTVADVVADVRADGIPAGRPAEWYYGMALALRDAGDPASALILSRAAVPSKPDDQNWLTTLAELEAEAGDLATAIDVQRRLAASTGLADPRVGLTLAKLYDRAGLWTNAVEVLRETLEHNPNNASCLRRLATVATSLATWQGTLSDTVPDRAAATFIPDTGDVDPATMAVDALTRAVRLEPKRTTWRAALGQALLAQGDLSAALDQYDRAVGEAAASDQRWALGAKQRWQFLTERTRHVLGSGVVDDPLFDASITPHGDPPEGAHAAAGLFDARFNYLGMTVSGLVAAGKGDAVDIYLDGRRIRTVNLPGEGYLPEFTVLVKRALLATFPREAKLEVRSADRRPLIGPGGGSAVTVRIPHGTGRLARLISEGGTLDKKGEISPPPAEMRRRQDRDLEIYSRVRDFFNHSLGRSLFLMYGTLLGYYRDGDLIPGDDDFDAGYVSDKSDPEAVKDEAKDIIVELVRAGFVVSFNRKGRLFRVQLDRAGSDQAHIDIHHLWFQDGDVWVHNLLSMPSATDDYLPVTDGTMRGVTVSVPHRSEVFLEGNYGPNWRTPDPGFRYYSSRVPLAARRNLEQALITPAEYRALAHRIAREVGEDPTAGQLVSLGSQSLYPLDQFIA